MNHTQVKTHTISQFKMNIGKYAVKFDHVIESFTASDFNQTEADIEVEINFNKLNIGDLQSHVMSIHQEIFYTLIESIKPATFTYTSSFYESKITGCHSLKFHFKIHVS